MMNGVFWLAVFGFIATACGIVWYAVRKHKERQAAEAARLADFLALLPEGHGAAFEFRNDTWFADDVYDALKRAGASLCLSEREDNAPPPLVETAPWGYVRLRLETYSARDLEHWAQRLSATGWAQVYVYFMHEPTAPAYAQTLMGFVE